MPKITNIFTGGKMNKDLDERLLPNKEYRDAMNVEVTSSDSSNVGSIQNSMGNLSMDSTGIVGAKCIGSIIDNEKQRIIWFINGDVIDAIVEFDLNSSDINPVLVDTQKNSSNSILRFTSDMLITGINILNGILFWTDNAGEPKKIDIDQMKLGLITEIRGTTQSTGTSFNINDGAIFGTFQGSTFSTKPPTASDFTLLIDGVESNKTYDFNSGVITAPVSINSGIKVKIILKTKLAIFSQRTFYIVKGYNRSFPKFHHITVMRRSPLNAPNIILSDTIRTGNVTNINIFTDSTFVNGNLNFWLYKELGSETVKVKPIGVNSLGPFYQTVENSIPSDPLLDNNLNPVVLDKISIPQNNDFKKGDIINLIAENGDENDLKLDKLKVTLLLGFEVSSNVFHCTILNISDNIAHGTTNSPPVNGGGTIIWNASIQQGKSLYENVFPRFAYRWKYDDDAYSTISPFTSVAFLPSNLGYDYDSELGHNLAMTNFVKRIKLSSFDPKPVDVVAVDILVKNSNENSIYVAETIQSNRVDIGEVEITQESINSILPSNQILRNFDNVPLKAKSQEVSASRIMYGNYVQQRNLITNFKKKVKFKFDVVSSNVNNEINEDVQAEGLQIFSGSLSVKSLRTYQVGVAFLDNFGRQTPVFSSEAATVKISQDRSFTKNQFQVNLESERPSWATHEKYFIKENSNEYYNIALDRYYNDTVDGDVWLSFSSNEVNKVEVDDYIVLKKAHGNNDAVGTQNNLTARYKVLAKESSAPDAIRFEKVLVGVINNAQFGKPDDSSPYTPTNNGFPVKDSIKLIVPFRKLKNTDLQRVNLLPSSGKYLKISILDQTAVDTGIESAYYEVSSVELNTTASDEEEHFYNFTLRKPFSSDIDFVQKFDDTPNNKSQFTFSYYEDNDDALSVEFKGRFFLKIKSDLTLKEKVLSTVNSTNAVNYIQYSQDFRYIKWDGVDNTPSSTGVSGGGATAAGDGETINNADYDKLCIDNLAEVAPYPNAYSTPTDPKNLQFWAIDEAMAIHRSQPNSDDAVQGNGWGNNGRRVTFRMFGRLPDSQIVGSQISHYGNYFFYDRLQQSQYVRSKNNINNITFLDKMENPVGVRIRWKHDPSVIYTITSASSFPVQNFSKTDNEFVSGQAPDLETPLMSINGIKFSLTLDTSSTRNIGGNALNIMTPVSSRHDPPSTAAGVRTLQIIESLPNQEAFFTKNPAIFEVEPKQQVVDLNLFYETPTTNFIPKKNYAVTVISSFWPSLAIINSVSRDCLTLSISSRTTTGIIPAGTIVKIHDGALASNLLAHNFDGTYVLAEEIPAGATTTVKLSPTSLSWFNCFSFGNGVESNRIQDDFNASFIDKGPKVSSTFSGVYKEQHRKTSIIYSGLFNSANEDNNSNQFIQAEKITKDLNPTYGSIQKLFARNTNMVVFCEDKTLKVLVDKSALFNADGKSQLLVTEKVLGAVTPFAGEYGISTNPESFASFGYRVYYTDKRKGAVLRLSGDGITNIAERGMVNYFKKNLRDTNVLIGSYDENKDLYNITLKYLTPTLNTTVSFSESVGGWSSFKSFIPENGTSLNGIYYTFYNGELWRHGSNVLRNTYYGVFTASKVKFILNGSPDIVKVFKTLSYNGSASKIYDASGDEQAKGWFTNLIKTDMQKGVIPYFISKENKWFNFIQGVEGVITTNKRAKRSFQGLGSLAGTDTLSGFYPFSLTGILSGNEQDGLPTFDWVGGNGLINGELSISLNLLTGAISQNQIFTIEPKIVNNVVYVIKASDFVIDTSFGSGGETQTPAISGGAINTITFANTESFSNFPSSANKVVVTVPLSFTMPTYQQSVSFRLIGNANPENSVVI